MNTHKAQVQARLHIAGTLECRDAEGRVIKTIDIAGSVPLDQADDAPAALETTEPQHGTDDCE